MQCYLSKRARSSGRNWKRRWFVFSEDGGTLQISYYKDEKTFAAKKKASGTVTLTSTERSKVTPLGIRDFALEIAVGDGTAKSTQRLVCHISNGVTHRLSGLCLL